VTRGKRSDYQSTKFTRRDARGLQLVAEQTFVPFDLLGQWFAPDLSPARTDCAEETAGEPRTHGGKRDHLPWPRDRNKRIHATAEIVRRWEKMGYAETWKPWIDEVTWVQCTQAGLRALGLQWNESAFPEDRDRLTLRSHVYRIAQIRLYLARLKAQAPAHQWVSERELRASQSHAPDATWPHRPDGILVVEAEGAFPGPALHTPDVIESIPLRPGQRIAIEVECSSKGPTRTGGKVLPSLLRHYDFAWYFCFGNDIYKTVIQARRDHLSSDEDRKRIRILEV
jgi:hypothetical protein